MGVVRLLASALRAVHAMSMLWQAFIAVSTEAPQLDQNYIHERVRAYAAGMQASEKYIVISK